MTCVCKTTERYTLLFSKKKREKNRFFLFYSFAQRNVLLLIFHAPRGFLTTHAHTRYIQLPAPGVVSGQQTAVFVVVLPPFRVPIGRTSGLHQAREE